MSGYGSLPLPLSARRTMRCKQLRMGGMQLFPVGAGRLQPNLCDTVPDSRPALRTGQQLWKEIGTFQDVVTICTYGWQCNTRSALNLYGMSIVKQYVLCKRF